MMVHLSTMSLEAFIEFVTTELGVPGGPLDASLPLLSQFEFDSVMMIELGVLLYDELDVDLPENIDYSTMTLTTIYDYYFAKTRRS